jgi:hypothetical protein
MPSKKRSFPFYKLLELMEIKKGFAVPDGRLRIRRYGLLALILWLLIPTLSEIYAMEEGGEKDGKRADRNGIHSSLSLFASIS